MIKTTEDFKAHVAKIESAPGYRKPLGFGLCRIVKGQLNPDKILTCAFPVVNWQENAGSAAVFWDAAGLAKSAAPEAIAGISTDFLKNALAAFAPYLAESSGDQHRNVQVIQALDRLVKDKTVDLENYRLVFIFEDKAPQSVPAIYLKLLALSTGKANLRGLNLDGIFGRLENVAWAGQQAYELDYLRQNEIDMKLSGAYPSIDYVDKFPRYLMHVIPADNTRILDTGKVRFGAQLAAGTTVMPGASYINFNSGTLGPVMVEGRISSSVVVGAGSDIGGGAGILGVLSGGNAIPITIGEKCLLGVNSVTGIPLGNGCIVDAGVSVLGGTRVFMDDKTMADLAAVNPGFDFKGQALKFHEDGQFYEFKAAALTGLNGLHFRTDSATGRMMVKRSAREVVLNEALHQVRKA